MSNTEAAAAPPCIEEEFQDLLLGLSVEDREEFCRLEYKKRTLNEMSTRLLAEARTLFFEATRLRDKADRLLAQVDFSDPDRALLMQYQALLADADGLVTQANLVLDDERRLANEWVRLLNEQVAILRASSQ